MTLFNCDTCIEIAFFANDKVVERFNSDYVCSSSFQDLSGSIVVEIEDCQSVSLLGFSYKSTRLQEDYFEL